MSTPVFDVQGVTASLGGSPVLHSIDLQLRPGIWTCIVGPNGAGKSTFLKTLAGVLPAAGKIDLQGALEGMVSQ